jgi:hypothetical protein
VVEEGFAKIESHVAPIIARLDSPGVELSDDDRLTLWAFILLLHLRSPAGLAYIQRLGEIGATEQRKASLSSPPTFRDAASGNPGARTLPVRIPPLREADSGGRDRLGPHADGRPRARRGLKPSVSVSACDRWARR